MTNVPTDVNFWLSIWNDIKNFGPSFYVFLIVFILWAYKQHIIDFANKLFDFFTNKKTTLKFTHKQLAKHQIFKDLDYWLTIGIKAIKLKVRIHKDDEEEYARNKEKMAKEVLRIIFETFKESLTKFIEDNDFDNMDEEVACAYLMDTLTKNDITERQKYIERGISEKFIHKFSVINDMGNKLIYTAVRNIFHKGSALNTPTKMYLAFNTLDGYLNIIFNNLTDAIDTINGDLKSETFDGEPMYRGYKARLKPPHSTYTMIVREKLQEALSETLASRINVIKGFEKDGTQFHSSIYEVVKTGVTYESSNIQMINDDAEKNVVNILKNEGIIAADISKFDDLTIERFNSRGVKGIIIAPIVIDDKLDSAIVFDYMSKESFEKFSNNKDLDSIINSYVEFMKPYVIYPENYKF